MRAGDTVRVTQKIDDKGKTRLQVFEGMILYRKHGTEAGATFTVRKTASGVGVERTFPLFSPMIETIEVVKRSKVRRSKLYYVRDKAAKEISKRMKMIMMSLGLKDEENKVDEANAEAEAENAAAAAEVETTEASQDEVTPEVETPEVETPTEEKGEETTPAEEAETPEVTPEVVEEAAPEVTPEVSEEKTEKEA